MAHPVRRIEGRRIPRATEAAQDNSHKPHHPGTNPETRSSSWGNLDPRPVGAVVFAPLHIDSTGAKWIAHWGNQVPDLRWLYVAVIVTAVSVVVHRKKIDRPAWYGNGGAKLLIAYVAWMWVQYFWSIAPDLQIEGATLFSKHLIMYYLVYTIVEDEETLARFALANVVGCFYFGWLAMGESGRVEDLGGSVSNANTLGMHLTTGLMFAAFLFQGLKNWMRWVAFATIPFILNAVILTQSRGTFLGLLGAGFVSFFLLPRSLRKGYYVSVGLGVVLFFILAHDQFLDRMSTMLNIGDETAEIDNSDASRIVIFQSGWEMAKDYPMGAYGCVWVRAIVGHGY